MKIATYNVNGINGRLPVLLRWLEESSPDVVCLQELKAPQSRFPASELEKAGYGAVWLGQKSWNGVAILAKEAEPVEVRRGLPGGADDDQSRYLEAAVNGILMACLYLPNGNPAPGPKFDYKLAWFDRLLSHTADLLAENVPIVLAGDFNVMPTELDVYKPASWEDDALFRPEVRGAYARLLKQGWLDSIRHLHPDERIYTFWDYLRNAWGRNAGLRLDHLLLSPQLADRLISAEVDSEVRGWEHASDHAPAWIELADKAPGGRKKATRKKAAVKSSRQTVEGGGDTRLKNYREKRDFATTPEPGAMIPKKAGNSFVIQEHHASRHHFDLRLEIDGVLASWAVPKEIPEEIGSRRLAVQTEDHPIDYQHFEGTIPKGNYGAGKMTIWDQGEWEPVEADWRRQWAKGTLKFHLKGKRLQAPYILARMKDEPNWMLMKLNPKTHPVASAAAPARTRKLSSLSSLESLPREKASYISPQLAQVVESAPTGSQWIHEIKLDGYRLVVVKQAGRLTIFTRNGHDWTDRFKGIAAALDRLSRKDFVVDGEAVVFDEEGRSNFGDLQAALGTSGTFGKGSGKSMTPRADNGTRAKKPISFVAFDLLHLDGANLRELPLSERLQHLARLIPEDSGAIVTRSRAWPGDAGKELGKQACELGLEGIMSKPLSGTYRPESRKEWLKSKCRPRQEFVVSGYTAGEGAFSGSFGALLLASREEGQWVDRGRVGTGFSEKLRESLFATLQKLKTKKVLFATKDKSITWIEPILVAEVEYAEITREGLVRQASFIGLREDKGAEEVHMEAPEKSSDKPAKPAATRKKAAATRGKSGPLVAGIVVSHPERVIYPGEGITKLEVVRHYERVGNLMLPYTAGRPLALLRVPDDVTKEVFFQKTFTSHHPPHVDTPTLPTGSEVIAVNSMEGIVSLAQFGVVEFHPWGAPLPDGEGPDFLTWDLDPDSTVPWPEVLGAALLLRDYLAKKGLDTMVKTSGGKGLHIVLHLKAGHGRDRDSMKAFTKAVASQIAAFNPKRFTTTVSLAKRKGKIFIDYLRNGRGATCVAPWCVRARPGAGVSMPISWDDLAELPPGGGFTIYDQPQKPKDWLKPKPQKISSKFLRELGF